MSFPPEKWRGWISPDDRLVSLLDPSFDELDRSTEHDLSEIEEIAEEIDDQA